MKIKAKEIKPGMVIGIKRIKKYNDICLVTACSGYTEIEYTHLDLQDAYGGLVVGTLDGEEKVKVINGDQRKYIIDVIKKDVFKNLHDIENVVDTIRLIEAMS